MHVAVSGSHGLIGSALTARLEAGGHTVMRLVRSDAGPGEASVGPAGGRLDPAVLGGVDAVVHLAGAGIGDRRWTQARRRELLSSRVDSTARISRAIAEAEPRPKVLLSASAVGYYGDRGDEELTEASAPGRGFLAGLCGQWEDATAAASRVGARVVHLRSGVVLAPRGGALGKQLPLFRLGLGGRLGSGRQYVSWIALEDEARAIEFLLSAPAVSGPANLTAPAPATNAELTATLGHVLHRPTKLAVPTTALRVVLGRGLADEVALASQRVAPAVLDAAGFTFIYPTLASALVAALS